MGYTMELKDALLIGIKFLLAITQESGSVRNFWMNFSWLSWREQSIRIAPSRSTAFTTRCPLNTSEEELKYDFLKIGPVKSICTRMIHVFRNFFQSILSSTARLTSQHHGSLMWLSTK